MRACRLPPSRKSICAIRRALKQRQQRSTARSTPCSTVQAFPAAEPFPPLDTFKVNFAGTRHLTDCLLPIMGEGGAIVSIASTGGLGWSRRVPVHMELMQTKGFDGAIAWAEAHMDQVAEGYAFSKEAVIVWTQFMCAQLIKRGIRINCTLPSPTQTPMMDTFQATSGKEVIDAAAEPLGRYSTAAEQAGRRGADGKSALRELSPAWCCRSMAASWARSPPDRSIFQK